MVIVIMVYRGAAEMVRRADDVTQVSTTRYAGKSVLITGAGAGIGLAIARRFAREGARVVGLDLVDPAADEFDATEELAGELTFTRGDVTELSSLEEAVRALVDETGRVDVMVNNAALTPPGWLHEFDVGTWRRTLDIIVTGTFFGCRAVLPHMMAAGRGVILNTGSTIVGPVPPRHPAYGAAKGGVAHLTRQVAVDYGPQGIRCNMICPGPTVTPKTRKSYFDERGELTERGTWLEQTIPLGRFAVPDEMAGTYTFLASEDASFISGATLFVDGAQSVHIGAVAPD
jgi:NAD(P)-dependent dehydrogenase (short-subunit alcohol dehydrogenase family)